MDFEKIKTAVEEISLSDIQKEVILNACKGKKRKFNYKPFAAVAAAAVIIIALISPGFLMKASSPDSAANEKAEDIMDNFYLYSADNDSVAEVGSGNFFAQSQYSSHVFEADNFDKIYSVIPHEFALLVSEDEYTLWASTVSPDGGMAIMQFVKHFNISREDFDRTNDVCGNLFDAEIIYSFDREIIDSYYRIK